QVHLTHVVREMRNQLAGCPPGEKGCRLAENVAEQLVPQVHDDPLPPLGHQISGDVAAEAFQEVGEQQQHGGLTDQFLLGQNFVEDGLELVDEQRRPGRVQHHRQKRNGELGPVGRRVPQQSKELFHSLNRYFSSTQSATTPSRQVIFFPSSYPRPSYVIGTS